MQAYLRSVVRNLLPPVAYDITRRVYRLLTRWRHRPDWYQIEDGTLEEQWILVNKSHPVFSSMVEGTYDAPFFEYVEKLDLRGKTACDVGAHIGFHTLALARLVGDAGQVRAFEPNPCNLERLKMNLGRNPMLAERVHVSDYALSDRDGETVLYCSPHVDDSSSSGAYIEGAHVPLSKDSYTKARFVERNVRTTTIDQLFQDGPQIALVKIDVEGAEHFVIEGALRTIGRDKPIILIEVHSVMAMLGVTKQLLKLQYEMAPLHIMSISRCLLVGEPR